VRNLVGLAPRDHHLRDVDYEITVNVTANIFLTDASVVAIVMRDSLVDAPTAVA
jgi:hypothetical protein